MEDQTLKNLWQKARLQGEDYYEDHKSEILEKAQKNSKTIFDRIYRTMMIEAGITLLICLVALPFLFMSSTLFFILFSLLIVMASLLSLQAFRKYRKQLSVIRSGSVVNSLKEKSHVLQSYISRIKKLTYFLMPPSFFLGFFYSVQQEGEVNWLALGIALVLSIPVILGLFWFTNKYLHLLYGRHLKKLREMIDHLEEH